MKPLKVIAVCVALVAPLAFAKDKKKDTLPSIFSNARYVYVQAEDGDIMKPGLFPEDREAIANVEDALKNWHRYALTINRHDADLVIIVRKGRLVGAQVTGGVGLGTAPGINGSYPNRNPAGPGSTVPADNNPDRTGTYESVGAKSEVGPNDDILRVYTNSPQGKLSGPFWSNEMKDGLDAPDVPLLRALRDAVDHAYPPQAVGQTGNQPAGQSGSQPAGQPAGQPGTQPAPQSAPQKKP